MERENLQAPGGMPAQEIKKPGRKPDFRIVQTWNDQSGKAIYGDVGAMWRNTSKSGSDFYTMKIGKLKLLVFPNRQESWTVNPNRHGSNINNL